MEIFHERVREIESWISCSADKQRTISRYEKIQYASTAQRRNPNSPRNAAAHAPPFPRCWHLHGRGNTTGRILPTLLFPHSNQEKNKRA